jgi:hypothetical protein
MNGNASPRRIAAQKEHTMIKEETMPTQAPRQSRREKFTKKQTEETLRFELLEKVATTITDAVAPLAVDAREQQSTIHIHVHGGVGLTKIRLELDGCGIHDADDVEQFEGE